MKSIISKTEALPVGAIATCVGLATLSNVYLALGFSGLRHLTMISVSFVWVGAMIKMLRYRKAFLTDYDLVVPSSLYATFTMLTMILGSYFFDFNHYIGRGIWLAGVGLHALHILVFTYRHVVKGIKFETMTPSWFVTYVGFLVSVVVGVPKGFPNLLMGIVFYGLGIFVILLPFMVWRMVKKPLPPQFGMTRAIFLAPTSLVIVGYLNVAQNPHTWFVVFLYGILFITIAYVVIKLPGFLGKPFNPGHAALTFPTAIALVATMRVANFLLAGGYETAGNLLRQFFGIQLWVTTAIIAYVAYGFLKIFTDSYKKA